MKDETVRAQERLTAAMGRYDGGEPERLEYERALFACFNAGLDPLTALRRAAAECDPPRVFEAAELLAS